ncbi:MAG: T9SS type A sorting domain-containing protein [Chitinophagaceae bacterium]|nr:T9SS type A sorting domain-containing protein [Chitinophagaceae bacterium]
MKKYIQALLLILGVFQQLEAQTISSTNFEISTSTFTNTNTVPKSYLVRFEIDKDTLVLVDSFDSNCLPLTSFQYNLIGTDTIEIVPFISGIPQNSYECIFGSTSPLTSYKVKYKLIPTTPLAKKTIIYRCNNYNVLIKTPTEATIERDFHLHEKFTYTTNEDLEHPLCSSKFEIIGTKLFFISSTLESQMCNMLCYATEMINDSICLRFQSPCASFCDLVYTANCYSVEVADTSNFTQLDLEFNNQWYHIEREQQTLNYTPQIPSFNGVLPITGLDIKVNHENEYNLIQWSTLTEENVSHFDILRSNDGKEFEKIGSKLAVGNSTTKNYYSFSAIENSKSIVFYKIKAVDIDGKYTESKIIKVSPFSIEDIKIFPNPTVNEINIQLPNQNEYQLSITNSLGKIIHNTTIQTFYKFENNTLTPGIYFLKISDIESGISINQKIIILN